MAAKLLVCVVFAISQVTGNNFGTQGGPQYNTQPAFQNVQSPAYSQLTSIRQQQQQVPNGGYRQQLQLSQVSGRPTQSSTAYQQFPANNGNFGNPTQFSQIKTVTEERYNNAAPQYTPGASQPQTQWASNQNQPRLPATNQGLSQLPNSNFNGGFTQQSPGAGFNQLQGLNQQPNRHQNQGSLNQQQGFTQQPRPSQNLGGFNQLQAFNQQPNDVQNLGGFNRPGVNQQYDRLQNSGVFNQPQGFRPESSQWGGQPIGLSNIQSRPQFLNQAGSNPTFTSINDPRIPQGGNFGRLSQAAVMNSANVQQGQGPTNQIDLVQEYNSNGDWGTLNKQTQQATVQNREPSRQVTQQWTQVANSQPSIARKYRPSKSSKRSRKPKPEVVPVTETTPEVSTEETLTASEE